MTQGGKFREAQEVQVDIEHQVRNLPQGTHLAQTVVVRPSILEAADRTAQEEDPDHMIVAGRPGNTAPAASARCTAAPDSPPHAGIRPLRRRWAPARRDRTRNPQRTSASQA